MICLHQGPSFNLETMGPWEGNLLDNSQGLSPSWTDSHYQPNNVQHWQPVRLALNARVGEINMVNPREIVGIYTQCAGKSGYATVTCSISGSWEKG